MKKRLAIDLERLSINSLSALYEAWTLSISAMRGICVQPRCEEVGILVEHLDDTMDEWGHYLTQIADEAKSRVTATDNSSMESLQLSEIILAYEIRCGAQPAELALVALSIAEQKSI